MKKNIFASLLCLLLAGCGPYAYHGPIQNLPYVPQEESAKLVFIAEEIDAEGITFGPFSIAYIPIIDGVESYSLELNQYVSFAVTPGEHIVKCSGPGVSTHPDSIIKINPQVGETVYLCCTYKGFFTVPRFKVTQLPEYHAQSLMKNATRVGAR